MIVDLQKGAVASELDLHKWDVAFHGSVLDDRGKEAMIEVSGRSKHVYELGYNAEKFEVNVAGSVLSVDDFETQFRSLSAGSVVLEATTLGFVEILLCCKALRQIRTKRADFVYVEPNSYHNPMRNHLLRRRDFELSGEVPGYRAVPGSTYLLGNHSAQQKCVFLLGYEESRLRRAFEDLQVISPAKTNLIMGVPAFKPGWEMDLIANNIKVIREQNIRGGLHYCGAENPAAVVEILSEIYRGLQPDERLFVAPIGTKPHGVGAALFVAANPRVGVLYDHPQRSSGRSADLGNWHLYSLREHQVVD